MKLHFVFGLLLLCLGTCFALTSSGVNSTLQANSDSVTFNSNGSGTYNVLSNDYYYGDCSTSASSQGVATTSTVTVTQVAPFSSYYSINSVGAIVANGLIPSWCEYYYHSSTKCSTASASVTLVPTIKIK